MPSELVKSQQKFARMVGQLLGFIYEHGWAVSFGECWRTPEQAELNAKKGIGIKNSLHCDRLAVDLNFWKDGALIPTPLEVVEFWEGIGGSAGYRFGDPPHFSLAYGGRK